MARSRAGRDRAPRGRRGAAERGRPAGERPPRAGERAARAGERARAGAAAAAVARFLDAVVPPAERGGADLAGTPERVAQAWLEDLLDGYRARPEEVLSETMPARGRDLVAVTGLDFHSMCPHHLLPSRGVAHVAYVPGEVVVGFGQLAKLVDLYAHRLALEEDVARSVAEALVARLGARGAACVLDAEQACLSVRGERRAASRAHAQCFLGELADDAALQRRFLAAIATGGASSAGRGSRAGRSRPGAGR